MLLTVFNSFWTTVVLYETILVNRINSSIILFISWNLLNIRKRNLSFNMIKYFLGTANRISLYQDKWRRVIQWNKPNLPRCNESMCGLWENDVPFHVCSRSFSLTWVMVSQSRTLAGTVWVVVPPVVAAFGVTTLRVWKDVKEGWLQLETLKHNSTVCVMSMAWTSWLYSYMLCAAAKESEDIKVIFLSNIPNHFQWLCVHDLIYTIYCIPYVCVF